MLLFLLSGFFFIQGVHNTQSHPNPHRKPVAYIRLFKLQSSRKKICISGLHYNHHWSIKKNPEV